MPAHRSRRSSNALWANSLDQTSSPVSTIGDFERAVAKWRTGRPCRLLTRMQLRQEIEEPHQAETIRWRNLCSTWMESFEMEFEGRPKQYIPGKSRRCLKPSISKLLECIAPRNGTRCGSCASPQNLSRPKQIGTVYSKMISDQGTGDKQ